MANPGAGEPGGSCRKATGAWLCTGTFHTAHPLKEHLGPGQRFRTESIWRTSPQETLASGAAISEQPEDHLRSRPDTQCPGQVQPDHRVPSARNNRPAESVASDYADANLRQVTCSVSTCQEGRSTASHAAREHTSNHEATGRKARRQDSRQSQSDAAGMESGVRALQAQSKVCVLRMARHALVT
jgi:hypothetical protein